MRNLLYALVIALAACSPAVVQQPAKPTLPSPKTESVFAPAQVTQPINQLPQAAQDLITDAEVSSVASDHSYYDRHYQKPTWPQGDSGVTIGIGVDLGFETGEFTKTSWSDYLDGDDVASLQTCNGVSGKAAKALCATMQDITIPWLTAASEFNVYEVPNYWSLTRRTFPGFDNLRLNAQGALVSLVYNRGSSLSGPSRVDMRTIRDAVKTKDYDAMAEAETHMLVTCGNSWRNAGIYDGMKTRRTSEANLILTP